MEETPTSKKIPDVEAEANYEGNDSLLLFERLESPIIFNQIVDLLYQAEQVDGRVATIHEADENGNLLYDSAGNPVMITGQALPRERERFENDLRSRIEEVKKDTPISFDLKGESNARKERELVVVNQCFPDQPKFTAKQLSIVEAHEKGHVVRRYVGDFFNKYFSGAIDPVELRPYISMNIEKYKGNADVWPKNDKGEPKTVDEVVKFNIAYMTSASEIAERMSQLKNYFGISGDETFAKEHLDYARQHYIEDTGMNNNMAAFFSMVTPATEEKFLEIINSAGI